MENKVLEVENLRTSFISNKKTFNAVDGVSFHINEGETIGVVGESGCGKSVTSLSIMGLIKRPGEVNADKISFQDNNLLKLNKEKMRKIRGNRISMIFQEPMTSLNPVYRVGEQIAESIRIHEKVRSSKLKNRVIDLLEMVGIPRPKEVYRYYPHQLSGGMRQRVMIAIAMACNPDLLIADEPTTALDVTIQAQILELMKELQESRGMSMMLITHDLGVVSEVCDRVVVMYAGKIVETGKVENILNHPQHPYTKGLIASLPKKGQNNGRLNYIPGQVPSPLNWGKGCRFADRCTYVMDKCLEQIPPLLDVSSKQQSACWLCEEKGGSCFANERGKVDQATIARSE